MPARNKRMRSSILVRPNLKLILLGALLIAVLHDVFTSGKSASSFRDYPYSASWITDKELDELIEDVDRRPNSTGYALISEAYEKRGNIRKALYYMQKADAMGRLEEPED
jgi:hypothetical protein